MEGDEGAGGGEGMTSTSLSLTSSTSLSLRNIIQRVMVILSEVEVLTKDDSYTRRSRSNKTIS